MRQRMSFTPPVCNFYRFRRQVLDELHIWTYRSYVRSRIKGHVWAWWEEDSQFFSSVLFSSEEVSRYLFSTIRWSRKGLVCSSRMSDSNNSKLEFRFNYKSFFFKVVHIYFLFEIRFVFKITYFLYPRQHLKQLAILCSHPYLFQRKGERLWERR